MVREASVNPQTILFLQTRVSGFAKGKDATVLWNCGNIAVLWGIWTKRNSRIFRDHDSPLHLHWDRAVHMPFLWASAKGAFSGISISDLQRDLSVTVVP